MSYAERLEELQRLRAEVRRLERVAEDEAKRMRPLTEHDELKMYADQALFDKAYVACGRKAPPPYGHERPREFERRLLTGLQALSPRWAKVDIGAMRDDVFPIASEQVRADAISSGRSHGLQPTEMRELPSTSLSGHRQIEFVGGENASFIKHFARPVRRAIFKSQEEYVRMSRDAQMAQIANAYQRPTVQAPRAGF